MTRNQYTELRLVEDQSLCWVSRKGRAGGLCSQSKNSEFNNFALFFWPIEAISTSIFSVQPLVSS